MTKEFCPTDCAGHEKPKTCNGRSPFEDGVRDRCWHLDDVLYDRAFPVRMTWTREEDRFTSVVGENRGQYILEDGSYVSKNTPLIKEWMGSYE